ncbi:MAG: hypothetical protein AAGI68_08800 [Planctomycetota bacterium]
MAASCSIVGPNVYRLPTLHALHLTIDAALREADIEIPFPQRDLHLRSSDLNNPPITTLDAEVATDQPIARDHDE